VYLGEENGRALNIPQRDNWRDEIAAEMGLCQCRDDYQCEHNSQAEDVDE
jgi:hypothetical protein